MIRIVFYRQGEVYYGFEETGHSGFDEAGHDIVCAAVSAMTMFLINAVEVAGKKLEDVKIVVNGAGAAAISCTRLYCLYSDPSVCLMIGNI